MNLYEKIGTNLKEAMKSGDTLRRDTLRLLQSAIKNTSIEKRKALSEFSDDEIENIIRRLVKQHRDSIEQYRAGNRDDLVNKEEDELRVLTAYLPQPMPEEELRALVGVVLKESGITVKSQTGQAMGIVMKKIAGRADGDNVRRMVEGLLA